MPRLVPGSVLNLPAMMNGQCSLLIATLWSDSLKKFMVLECCTHIISTNGPSITNFLGLITNATGLMRTPHAEGIAINVSDSNICSVGTLNPHTSFHSATVA